MGGVITSGGGFSNYNARPSWQTSAVTNYFAALGTNQPAPGYSISGRGYPDVSLLGVSYEVVMSGALQSVYGTSCSAPVFAAMGELSSAISIYLCVLIG